MNDCSGMNASPDDDLRRDLWRQVTSPWLLSHPGHGAGGEVLLARLWISDVQWRPEHLQALPAVVRLGMAPEPQLAAAVRGFGLLPYARSLRETLSGALLKRVERALGPDDWARLLRAEAAVDVLAPDDTELRPLTDLLDGATDQVRQGLDLLGAQGLAACFAAFGEPWRLRLGLRLRPEWHEAVLAAVARPRKQAERRLDWALVSITPAVTGEAPTARDGEASRNGEVPRDGEAPRGGEVPR